MSYKQILKSISVIVLLSIMILPGCGVTVREHPNYHSRTHYTPDHRREYEARFNNNDRRIRELKAGDHHDQAIVIEIRNENAKRRLNEFKGNTKQEWNSFKRELDRDVRSVEISLKSIPKDKKRHGKR